MNVISSKTLSYDTTLEAMKRLAGGSRRSARAYTESGHPIDINVVLEPEYLKAAAEVSQEMHLDQPIPKLCTLVTASPFDAAIHDAFGKVHHLNCYLTYGPEFRVTTWPIILRRNLRGSFPASIFCALPKPWLWCNHSVGAGDPIEAADVKKRLNDGLPQTLDEWIVADGITHLKIKLNGNNLERDVERVLHIDRVAAEVEGRQQREHHGAIRWTQRAMPGYRLPAQFHPPNSKGIAGRL